MDASEGPPWVRERQPHSRLNPYSIGVGKTMGGKANSSGYFEAFGGLATCDALDLLHILELLPPPRVDK